MRPSLKFDHVSKRYRLGQSAPSLRSLLRSKKSSQGERYHWAINDISFEMEPGHSMGIIGPNGAGKTTILKLLSKVTRPTHGEIKVNGRFSALIELGAGFHPDLTGRENIYLNGTILGMKKSEINARFDEIVEFAGIGRYLDTPVKRYSSGMYARLGFSVAAHIDPEILLVDEVLAVGDMAFQKKCYDRMKLLTKEGKTIIFVSHNLRAIQSVTSRCLVLYRGNKVFDGDSAEAIAEYSNIIRQAAEEYRNDEEIEKGISQRIMTHTATIEDVSMVSEEGSSTATFSAGDLVRVRAKIKFDEAADSPVLACRIQQPNGTVVYDFTTLWAEIPVQKFEANTVVEIEFKLRLNLVEGIYQLGVNIAYNDLSRYYDRIDRAQDFVITDTKGGRGIADLQADFSVTNIQPLGLREPVG